MNPTTIAAGCAVLGSVLIVVCIALLSDWRWAIGAVGGFLLAVGLLIDHPDGKT